MSCSECRGHVGVSCPVCGPQPDECPECHGLGHTGYYALNIVTRKVVKVTESTWNCLPEDEDMTEAMNRTGMRRQSWCRMEKEPCRMCGGDGVV